VEVEGAGDAVEHLVGDAADVAAFEPGVVLDRDAGQLRHLVPAQSGHPAPAAVAGQAGLLGGDLGTPGGQELPDLAADVLHAGHVSEARQAARGQGGPASTPNTSISLRLRASGCLDVMSMSIVTSSHRARSGRRDASSPGFTLAAAVLGFFVVTLDATVVNVALPSVRADFGGGISGLQWVVDGYTLMFAALLLSAGALADRIGARRAFGAGVAGFVLASAACGVAPGLGVLVAARLVQGAAAAVMMPSSMALIGQAFPDPARRARAVGMWALGGAAASSAGPVAGGLLTLASWRLIFFINVPAGAAALVLLARAAPSPRRPAPFDW